jgi:hypothetical protein
VEKQPDKTPKPAAKTWMPMAGGILTIVSGVLGFIAVAFLITFGATFGSDIAHDILRSLGFWQAGLPLKIISFIAIPLIIINAVAIIGGIYAVQRRGWGLALAGSICAVLPSRLLGIPAIIFIALSQKEFE